MNKKYYSRVAAITVTFNSSRTLIHTIQKIEQQTYPVEWVLIVDNASDEKNRNALIDMEQTYDNIVLLSLKENTGGAGGFEAGMRYAKTHWNPEWFWIMDDDAYPRNNCLEHLDRKSTRLNSSHRSLSRMPSSA